MGIQINPEQMSFEKFKACLETILQHDHHYTYLNGHFWTETGLQLLKALYDDVYDEAKDAGYDSARYSYDEGILE